MRPGLRDLVVAVRQPRTLAALSPEGWSELIRTARQANLLGRLALAVEQSRIEPVPQAVRHLTGARQLCERQVRSVQWEVHCLHRALAGLGVPVVLLKGAAYVMGRHAVAQGRLFGDVDILVPRTALPAVESALMLAGWDSVKTDPYDQRYYRQWMHELPPLVHFKRRTVVDVHHRLLPLTARHGSDAGAIFAAARDLPGLAGFKLPAPCDLLVHSCTHLVHEGELGNGLRDLLDIETLIAEFSGQRDFWPGVAGACTGNGLAGPVGFALRLCRRIVGAPIPDDVLMQLRAPRGTAWGARWLEPVFEAAMASTIGGQPSAMQGAAAAWVYLRAHALRMSTPLLAKHLTIKAWMGLYGRLRAQPR